MNSLSRLRHHAGLISLLVAVIGVIITVVYSQIQLNQSNRALNFNAFAVLRSNYFDTRNEYWKASVAATAGQEADPISSEFGSTFGERLFKDHLDAIKLFCRLFEEERLGSDGIQFLEDTIQRDVETFRSDRVLQYLGVLGMSAADIPACDGP